MTHGSQYADYVDNHLTKKNDIRWWNKKYPKIFGTIYCLNYED